MSFQTFGGEQSPSRRRVDGSPDNGGRRGRGGTGGRRKGDFQRPVS